MPRKLILALVTAAVAVSLTGCDTEVYGTLDNPVEPYSVEHQEYRGETLYCSEGNGRISGCDYIRFYAEHPDLLEESEKVGKANLAQKRDSSENLEGSDESSETPERSETEDDLEAPTPAG